MGQICLEFYYIYVYLYKFIFFLTPLCAVGAGLPHSGQCGGFSGRVRDHWTAFSTLRRRALSSPTLRRIGGASQKTYESGFLRVLVHVDDFQNISMDITHMNSDKFIWPYRSPHCKVGLFPPEGFFLIFSRIFDWGPLREVLCFVQRVIQGGG